MRTHAHKVRWPGVVYAGGVTTQQWCFYDFLQTAAGIAGVQPDALPADLDGYSLLPTLMHGDGENSCGRVHKLIAATITPTAIFVTLRLHTSRCPAPAFVRLPRILWLL